MVHCLNEQPHVTFKEVTSNVFFDYGDLLDRFYKPFPAGSVQSNHVFWVESARPTIVFTKETALEPSISINFCKDKFVSNEDRLRELREYSLKGIAAPGMKEIKQVELYTKWRRFVPLEFADEICPKPPDEILEKVQKERSNKSKERNARKRSRTAAGTAGRGRGGRGRGGRGAS